MIDAKEHIGEIICEYQNGHRYQVNHVSDQHLYRGHENGGTSCVPARFVDGGVELDEERRASFQNNRALAGMLQAAELAAMRRVAAEVPGSIEVQDALRVLAVVDEQRDALENKLIQERQTQKAGPALANQFLDNLQARGPSSSAVFFGAKVKHISNGTLFSVNGTMQSKQTAASFLSNLTAERPSRSKSIDTLLASAQSRAGNQQDQPLPARISDRVK